MNKICIISISNIYTTPYISIYTDILKNSEYDIIYWDRDDITESIEATNRYIYKGNSSKKIEKFSSYIGFSKYCKRIINENKYNKLIFLSSLTAIINILVCKNYKGKYITETRDYTLEKNKLFFSFEKYILKNSYINMISSEAYKSFLPINCRYQLLHNLQKMKTIRNRYTKVNDDSIVLSFIGQITYLKENYKVIQVFKNDKRFKLQYIGSNSEKIREYCINNNITNVKTIGRFKPEQTFGFYENTDFIINAYGNNDPRLDYAISNKFYFSLALKTPILVNENTYMDKLTKEIGNGIAINYNDNQFKEKIIKYLDDFKKNDEIFKKMDCYLQNVISNNVEAKLKIQNFLVGKGDKIK